MLRRVAAALANSPARKPLGPVNADMMELTTPSQNANMPGGISPSDALALKRWKDSQQQGNPFPTPINGDPFPMPIGAPQGNPFPAPIGSMQLPFDPAKGWY